MQAPVPRAGAAVAAALLAALVLYASLYPFDDWRWPPGRTLAELLVLPWPRYQSPFDVWSNFLGYVPLGLLLALTARRPGGWNGWLLAVGAGAMLSCGAEVAQQFLPSRHPSLLDLALNSGGTLLGATLAPLLLRLGWPQRSARWLARWFDAGSAGAVLLLLLWPLALLFPAPVALGLGQIGPRLLPLAAELLEGVPWASDWHAALLAEGLPAAPLGVPAEALITALGLLAPCLVAFAVVPPGWRRMGLALGAAGLTAAVLTLSTALNFGPDHALTWLAPSTLPALVAGTAAALLLAWVPRRVAVGLGLVVVTALVMGVAQAPADPYFALSLQRWEQGRFIRFHGLAQWIGWLWPYGAGLWLLGRLGAPPTIQR
ncbi:MAG: VanZ family protein [Rubrivivax sp.]|nr:VanZ family protein [Rubrivivax sp.]